MTKHILEASSDGASSERASETVVPAVAANVPAARTGRVVYDTLDIRIDRSGVWYYRGSPIRRKELVCLFSSVLHRDEDGGYWLITPTELGPIDVEDAPFLAVELYAGGDGREQILSMRSNVDELVTVDDEHPLRVEHDPGTGEPSPYLHLHGGIEARITRSVFYELVGLGVEETIDGQRRFGVWSSGRFFVLGSLDADS